MTQINPITGRRERPVYLPVPGGTATVWVDDENDAMVTDPAGDEDPALPHDWVFPLIDPSAEHWVQPGEDIDLL